MVGEPFFLCPHVFFEVSLTALQQMSFDAVLDLTADVFFFFFSQIVFFTMYFAWPQIFIYRNDLLVSAGGSARET